MDLIGPISLLLNIIGVAFSLVCISVVIMAGVAIGKKRKRNAMRACIK